MTATDDDARSSPLLAAILNLSGSTASTRSSTPRRLTSGAVVLQRHARALHALADRWAEVAPSTDPPLSPFAGAADLNDSAALQLEGVLFMEGEGTPPEITSLVRDLRTTADDFASIGDWLANAMQASWDIAPMLMEIRGLEDLLGDRHRIIANDWLAAHMSTLIGSHLTRAADILGYHRLHARSAARRPRGASPCRLPAPLRRRDHQPSC